MSDISGLPTMAISARKLKKTYAASGGNPPKQALKGIDLDIPQGSIFGLLGPNGAGKSTFINILAGLVVKSSGAAEVWGFDIDANPRMARASIGVVPQELNLDAYFTPLESMELQAGLYGVPKHQRRSMELLEAMQLGDKANAYARTLSGGMRRRLLVAKAMVHQPPILVLDEPTAGVDLELRKQLWDYVQDLNRRGVTIVLTTHYLEEAQALCDRIAIIDHGEVVACDDTSNLLSLIDRKTLVIRTQNTLKELSPPVRDALAAFDPVLKADGRLSLTFNPGQDTAGDILNILSAQGIAIADIETEGNSLENVFMKLTSKSR
ncbi:MAG: ABC transporter ATP-binding protein [Parvibaculales bacterium]